MKEDTDKNSKRSEGGTEKLHLESEAIPYRRERGDLSLPNALGHVQSQAVVLVGVLRNRRTVFQNRAQLYWSCFNGKEKGANLPHFPKEQQ